MNKNYIGQYLPKMKQSIPIGHVFGTIKAKPDNTAFKRYRLFETALVNGVVNIFCGGPITAMAWAPTDYNESECEQILAVAVQPDITKIYDYTKNDVHKSVIQLWNFGVLQNNQPFSAVPHLEVIIAHQNGGCFSMEWCPSGAYEGGDGVRLGLLAACCTDGNVYCYSVGRGNLLK